MPGLPRRSLFGTKARASLDDLENVGIYQPLRLRPYLVWEYVQQSLISNFVIMVVNLLTYVPTSIVTNWTV